MKIKLTETLHLSELGRDAQPAGTKIDLPETAAKSLIDRGLAIKIEGNPRRKATKRAAAPKNKKAAPLSNKGAR